MQDSISDVIGVAFLAFWALGFVMWLVTRRRPTDDNTRQQDD